MAEDNKYVGNRLEPVPNPGIQIGIDTNNTLQKQVINALRDEDELQMSTLDIGSIEGLNGVAKNRDQLYRGIEEMASDDTVAAILETYTEDTVEPNDKGDIVWVESSDEECGKYVNYLLNSLQVNKNVYSWAKSLVTYGDVYLRLYRQSEYDEDVWFVPKVMPTKDNKLNEDINIQVNDSKDPFVHYVELYPNPAEVFDLTKFGKTAGFGVASVSTQTIDSDTGLYIPSITYRIKRDDITLYDSTTFVHGCLEDNISRVPEEVNIFLDNGDVNNKKVKQSTYKVKRGLPLLYNSYRLWREMNLLENSIMISRITKSAILRILNVDVGDMPKEEIRKYLAKLKRLVEQKISLNKDVGMNEYNSPGPIDNFIYTTTHGTQGAITASTIGGDYDPKKLTDLEYIQNKFFGSARIPKAYFGITDDGAGFNGGQSLSIISSRYGKSVKRIQNVICQLVTDIVNIFLLDKGLVRYINKFTICMQPPITQDELDRRTNTDNRIRYIGDVMNQLGDITNPVIKLKILKSLLTTVVNDPEVISYVQEQIDELENENEEAEEKTEESSSTPREEESDMPAFEREDEEETTSLPPTLPQEQTEETPVETPIEDEETEEDSFLPSPEELGFDAVNNI